MTNYFFTSDHFKLLNKWKGQRRDESNPEQTRAYEELKRAYDVTQAWAAKVKEVMFPMGAIEVRKRPTTQANTFADYNWAKIYPSSEAPKELAYTVGIDADDGFVVKIDTVGLEESSDTRKAYMAFRGNNDDAAPFVAKLTAAEGLEKTLDQLAAWTIEAIRGFEMRYEDVVEKLKLGALLGDEDLLRRFDAKPSFQTFRASWSEPQKAQFCRLARAIHDAGLDWWHVDIDVQLRFGRKNPGSDRAVGVLGYVTGTKERLVSWSPRGRELIRLDNERLSEVSLQKLETSLRARRDQIAEWLPLDYYRPGLWPDELRDEGADPDELDEPAIGEGKRAARRVVNRIYYGPPGTGKTYEISRLLKREYEQAVSAVSTEEWQRQLIQTRIVGLTWWEGVAAALHDLGGKAKVGQIHDHAFVQAIAAAKGRTQNVKQTLWGTLQHHTIDASSTVNTKLRLAPLIFDKTSQSVWQLAGDWKEECADLIDFVEEYGAGPPSAGVVQRHSFVTFHQSYGYEEFVEGLRPVLSAGVESTGVQCEIRSGVFKDLCRRARSAPDQRFAMVIDEINRGNISKIFGELITLIEPDKREGSESAVSVTLPYSGESFSVPNNVDIIGTMNTADRSLALLDTALRRRFEFVPVMPDARDSDAPLAGLRVRWGEREIHIPRMLDAINRRIEALYDRDHCIGHAYFTPLAQIPQGDEQLAALQQVFRTRILPLLEEYFFEDWQKIRLVLADNQKAEKAQFVRASNDQDEDLARLFGSDHGLDSYSTKNRYEVQDAAFWNPDSYVGIYQTLSG